MSGVGENPQHMEVPDRLRSVKKKVPAPVKNQLRQGLRRYGLVTASRRVLPNFLIIGTKRGGTTSLWNWLLSHPAVVPMFPASQQIKSSHYFDNNYWRGLDWYRSHFPTEAQMARVERRLSTRPVTGEASPYYMFHPAAPARIAADLPEAKIIVLLRDPVARAYSNYWERRGSGAEPLSTFEQALDAEPRRLQGQAERLLADAKYYSFSHDNHSYLARGRYLEQLAAWLDRWPRDQLLIVKSEDLFAQPHAVFVTVLAFLGLPSSDEVRLAHHHRLPTPPISPSTQRYLRQYYQPHNSGLYEALETDFGWASDDSA